MNVKNQSFNKVETGIWLRDGYNKYHCSVCLFRLFDNLYYQDKYGEDTSFKYKFCPNCGAKMNMGEE